MNSAWHIYLERLLADLLRALSRIPGTDNTKLARLMPARQLGKVPFRVTNRDVFRKERYIYRLSRRFIGEGMDIDRRSYYIYRNIALKYGWPYIKELYDNEPNPCFDAGPITLSFIDWWRLFVNTIIALDILVSLLVIRAMASDPVTGSSVTRTQSMIIVLTMLQILFLSLVLLFRLAGKIRLRIKATSR